MTYKYKISEPGKKITTRCDNCKKLLRKADAYETLNDKILKNLCSKCFDKWINNEIGELK